MITDRKFINAFTDQTVLVTGGAGAIGSNLCRALAENGARVIVLDNLSSAEHWNVPSLPEVLFVEGDDVLTLGLHRQRPE